MFFFFLPFSIPPPRFSAILDDMTIPESQKRTMFSWSVKRKWFLVCLQETKSSKKETRSKAPSKLIQELEEEFSGETLKELTISLRTEPTSWTRAFVGELGILVLYFFDGVFRGGWWFFFV